MGCEASHERVVDSLGRRVVKRSGCFDEVQRATQVAQANITSFCLLHNHAFCFDIKLEDLSPVILRQATCLQGLLCVSLDDLPQISFIIHLSYVDFCEFSPKNRWQLLLSGRRVWRIHAHKYSKLRVHFGLHYICSLIQQYVVPLHYGGKFIENGLRCEINLIQKDPVTVLHTLDQSAFNKLKHEASALFQLQ